MEKSKLSQIVISEAFETIKRENRKLQKENAELKKYSNLRQKDIEQFKHFGDLLRIGIFLITPDGLLIDCNAQFTEMLGQSEKDKILGINIFNNYFPGFSKVDFLNEIIVKKTVLELEVKLNSDAEPGKRFYLSAEGTIDSNGRIKQIIGTLRNISERMESAAADIQLFKDLTDNAKDGILIANDRAFFIYANKKAAELLGYSEEELLT
ncbi:MAG: PAS domain-containing protein, partial [Ignavibacteriales bacterium]